MQFFFFAVNTMRLAAIFTAHIHMEQAYRPVTGLLMSGVPLVASRAWTGVSPRVLPAVDGGMTVSFFVFWPEPFLLDTRCQLVLTPSRL